MIKVLLFDFTGVIAIDGFWQWMSLHIPDIEKYKPYFKKKSVKWDKGNISLREEMKKFGQEVNIPFEKIWQGVIDNFKPDEKMLKLIASLRSKYKIGILSNFPRELFEALEKKYAFAEYFDDMIISSVKELSFLLES